LFGRLNNHTQYINGSMNIYTSTFEKSNVYTKLICYQRHSVYFYK
jgi:hypothetical protein